MLFRSPVNWKVVVENNLESYHIGTVHAGTLGAFPAERECGHELDAGGSRFEAAGDTGYLSGIKRHLARRLGREMTERYVHAVVHPALMWVAVDIGAGFQSVVPTGPSSCRIVFRSAGWQSGGTKPLVDWAVRRIHGVALPLWRRVVGEDLALMPQVQAGIASPRHPGPGLVSRREERITHFQRWLLERLDGSDVAGPAAHGRTRREDVA